MRKTSKNLTTKKVATKKAIQNIRNEAKSKNLEFLLDPKQPQVIIKRTRSTQEKSDMKYHGKEATATTVPCTKRPSIRSIQTKGNVTKVPSTAGASQAKRRAVRVPLIDMDADDNNHQLEIKTKLLQDWVSDIESDGDDNGSDIDLSGEFVELDGCESRLDYHSLPNDVKSGHTDLPKAGISESSRKTTNHAPQSDSGSVVDQDAVHALAAVGKPLAIRKTYARISTPSPVIPQSDIGTLATGFEQSSEMNQFSSSPAPMIETISESSVCVCGQQSKIDALIQQNNILVSQNKKLKRSNEQSNIRCLALTDSLNAKVLGTPQDEIFTEEEGLPKKDKLKKFSETAGSRDYIFVKMLLLEISPEGLQNTTVTGRTSNNPNGRKGGERFQEKESSEKVGLDPEKVEYIEARFVEHRRYQGDSSAVAGIKMKGCRGLMARVISYYGKK